MSDMTLDLQEQIARIDRAQAETRKFVTEQNKLAEEALKFFEEARKLRRDRWWQPALAISGLIGGMAGLIGGAAGIVSLLLRFNGVK